MNRPKNNPPRNPNPKTRAAHRKEFFWHILFPLLLSNIILAVIAVVIVLNDVGTVSNWADIALIALMLPAMIFLVIPLGIVVLLIFGSSRILSIFPGYSHQVHKFFKKIKVRVQDYSDLIVKPFIFMMSIFTMTKPAPGRGDREESQKSVSQEKTQKVDIFKNQ